MGIFSQRITVSDLAGQNSVEIDAVVDTGAFYSVLPSYLLRELGVEPIDRARSARPTIDIWRWRSAMSGSR